MKIQLSGGVLFCLSILAGCGGGGGGGGGNADCGESPSSTSCTISPAASVNEAISSAEDKDYYKVTVIQAGLLTAETTSNTNTHGTLSDIAGVMITSDDNSGVEICGAASSFARLYRSRERGTKEITIAPEQVRHAIHKLNRRPQKCNYKHTHF